MYSPEIVDQCSRTGAKLLAPDEEYFLTTNKYSCNLRCILSSQCTYFVFIPAEDLCQISHQYTLPGPGNNDIAAKYCITTGNVLQKPYRYYLVLGVGLLNSTFTLLFEVIRSNSFRERMLQWVETQISTLLHSAFSVFLTVTA